MDLETLSSFGDFGYFSAPPPESPQIDFSEIMSFAAPAPAPEAEAPEDGRRRPSGTDDDAADTLGVNAADAAAPQPQRCPGSNHHHVDVDVDVDVDADADADAGVDDHREEAKIQRRRRVLDSFKSAVEQDLSTSTQKFKKLPLGSYLTYFLLYCSMSSSSGGGGECCHRVQWCGGFPPPGHGDIISTETPCSVVRFNPDSKADRKTTRKGQGCWKEKGMAGMRAAEPPSSQLLPGQQGYVGLKKTLELHGGGTAGKWRAHEYTPLLPSEDGTKLVPADISLRVVFKDDENNPSSSSSKRPRTTTDDGPKNGPNARNHMYGNT